MFKAAIRVNKLKTVAQLRGASIHAHRDDETSRLRLREGAVAGVGLAWSKAEDDRDYLAAFRAHKAELHAAERKNAPLALQALCVVSPEWVQQAGDLHDPQNPRNRQLFAEARSWAESWAGKGAVFGARLDLDEKGGAVVDLLIAPVRESRGKPVISTQKALVDLKGFTGERNEYSALQTSWAEWCGDRLDQAIVRGTRRELTAREHLSPETYGAVLDKAREALREPPETVLAALRDVEVHHRDAEALAATLSGLVTLKGEISRHKAEGRLYEAPEASARLSDPGTWPFDAHRRPWPIISAIRERAERVLEAASWFGVSWPALQRDRGYTAAREHFPRLEDRMHLAAVVAHCGAFCAKVEATVKNLLAGRTVVSEAHCWPENAAQEVERHQMALGLVALEVRERAPQARVHAPKAEQVTEVQGESEAAGLAATKARLASILAKPTRSHEDDKPTHERHERSRGHGRGDDDGWGL